MKTHAILFWFMIPVLFWSSYAHAKKVICVDGCNTGFVNVHEGYERNQMGAADKIQVGGKLDDCLAMLANGDTLIIVAHGNGRGTRFWWDGARYTGFGAAGAAGQGTNPHPVPAGFGALASITVEFCTCWSSRDPDGAGPNTSLLDKIKLAMGGGGHPAGTGFSDEALANYSWKFTGTVQQIRDGSRHLVAQLCPPENNDLTWLKNPPANRSDPAPEPNQQSAAQALLDAHFAQLPDGTVTVTLTYDKAPENKMQAPAGVAGCMCVDAPPGCGFTLGVSEEVIPAVSDVGLVALLLLTAVAGVIVIRRARRGHAAA